jgi:lipid-A-disaccharide synthase
MLLAAGDPKILVLTGEASGDRYGALLATALRRLTPTIRIAGIGGGRMADAGVDLLFDADRIAVTGIFEVAAAFGSILAAWRAARAHLLRERPDLVVLIDYPDFNLRFARVAHRAGIPVVYFVGPQVWAWRRYRVRQIARDVDEMLVILPFEEAFYRRHGVHAKFVGHPLVDLVRRTAPRAEAARALGLDPARPVLGLLPGSRRNEVRTLLPRFLDAAAIVAERIPGAQFVLPEATGIAESEFTALLSAAAVPVRRLTGAFDRVVSACDVAFVASGTATLETALLGVPPVIAYRVHSSTYALARSLSSLNLVGLPNLILGRRAFSECIQRDCAPGPLAAAAVPLFGATAERAAAERALAEIPARLGGGGGIDRAASEVTSILRGRLRTDAGGDAVLTAPKQRR